MYARRRAFYFDGHAPARNPGLPPERYCPRCLADTMVKPR
jgi:hypothetical protein